MLHAGLDLSRTKLDVCILDDAGTQLASTLCPPDADGLRGLVKEVGALGGPVQAVIESMTGARFVHDTLELCGWDVEIADAQKAKGLAPLTCKTDKIDAWVLAELSRRDLVPSIWLPTPGVRAERERARFRLHLVRHRTHAQEPDPCDPHHLRQALCGLGPVRVGWPRDARSDRGARAMAVQHRRRAHAHRPSGRGDRLDRAGAAGSRRDHPYVPLLTTAPGIGWILGYTIASEIGDIHRFATPKKLVGYTGLCPSRLPVRLHGPARAARQERPQVPALGAHRGDDARVAAPRLQRALRPHRGAPRAPAWTQDRACRGRAQARRGHLAHVSDRCCVRTRDRSHSNSGRLTALNELDRPGAPTEPDPRNDEAIER